MISKTKLAAIAIVATVGMASPAFAEFLETGTATNNAEGGLGNGRYAWTAPQGGQVLYDRSGRSAYAMVPYGQAGRSTIRRSTAAEATVTTNPSVTTGKQTCPGERKRRTGLAPSSFRIFGSDEDHASFSNGPFSCSLLSLPRPIASPGQRTIEAAALFVPHTGDQP